ncbi:MAG: antibiotic biosynthesis monooxygenase [Planctomycetes bacterium]|nr:antibiotic biosynthesis monooxygenase [Planctomycetota bacterium]
MIHVIATIELNPGTRDAFLTEFHRIVAPVRAEAGCLDYGPTIDAETGIAAQGSLRADVVTVVERWESLEHLQAHLVAPHMVEYRPKVKDFVRSVKLQILKPV